MKFKFLEIRKQNNELKNKIKEISNDLSFMTKELKEKGGLGRVSERYGDFLNGLDQDKFILIRQSVNVVLSKTDKLLEGKIDMSESVRNNLLKLKEICENIISIEWEPYIAEVYENNDFSKKIKKETLSFKDNKNERMSKLLSDIFHPISNLENAKFQSIFDNKIEPDRYHI
jgi:hypothetical protein